MLPQSSASHSGFSPKLTGYNVLKLNFSLFFSTNLGLQHSSSHSEIVGTISDQFQPAAGAGSLTLTAVQVGGAGERLELNRNGNW